MFPLTAFTSDTVSRLTGLSVRQLHHWDRTNFFVPTFADPERRRPQSRVYSFDDVVGLRTIADLRRQGVSFPELKKVRRFFDSDHNRDWASRRFWVVGNRVFFSEGDAVVAARPLGQLVEPRVLELGPVAEDVRAAVRALGQRFKDQIGAVVRDRMIMGGAPIIAGTRIPTATVDWFYRNGYSIPDILQNFPRLTPDDIRAAVEYQEQQRRAESECARTAG